MDDYQSPTPVELHPEWTEGLLKPHEINSFWGSLFYFDEETREVLFDDEFYLATPDQMKIIKLLWETFCKKGMYAVVTSAQIKERCFPTEHNPQLRHKFRSNIRLRKALITSPRKGAYKLTLDFY